MAITISTPSDINLFMFNDWITVAYGNIKTINFVNNIPVTIPDFVTQTPLSITIGGTETNDTLSVVSAVRDSDSYTETFNYHYEVIKPKVVYYRNANSTAISFVDVTKAPTYSHPHSIPVNNNVWMQNPYITRGVVVIEKYNDLTLLWEVVGRVSLGSEMLVRNLPETNCTYRTKFQIRLTPNCGGTSPVIFEAIGDEFILAAWNYVQPTPYVSSVTGEDLKYYVCNSGGNLNLTFEIDKPFQTFFNSSNIDYTYQYATSSLSPTLPLTLNYSSISKSVTGSIDELYSLTNHDIIFEGETLQFIDGLLVYEGNFYQESKTFGLEGVRPNIDLVEQVSCSYDVSISDNTIIENPCLIALGKVWYEIMLNGVWVSIGSYTRLQDFIYKNCLEVGTYQLRNKFIARQRLNCGGTSPIIFETDWYYFNTPDVYTFTIQEFVPVITLDNSQCCYVIDEKFTIYPTSIELNNNVCPVGILIDGGFSPLHFSTHFAMYNLAFQKLVYTLFYYDNSLSVYVPMDSVTYSVATNSPLDFPYIYTPDKYGTYKLVATLSNCCKTVEAIRYINICDSFLIKPVCAGVSECDKCNYYDMINYSTNEITVDIYNYKNIKIDTIKVESLKTLRYKFLEDGIYILKWKIDGVDKNSVLNIMCTLDNCYTNLLKEHLCITKKKCCDPKVFTDSKLNVIQPLYQTYLAMIEKYTNLNVRYSNLDISNMLSDFQDLDLIKKSLLEHCDYCKNNCSSCYQWSSGTCL